MMTAHGSPRTAPSTPAASEWELFNLTTDPDERTSRHVTDAAPCARMSEILERTRNAQRKVPRHRNGALDG
jgi:hypothetical protein